MTMYLYSKIIENMKPSIDIDSLRSEHESDEQWQVRRSFMLEHKDNFDEDELVTLAQLYTNIEFLGCRYPVETMKRIAKLAEKVSAKYKESRKNKLKRTFVEASDAAEQKAKRTFKQ
ncbi:partner of xrn-2 protein 1-like [Pieris brassicae]|uniref:partner of xrn-2 protein 1-like n=1 Tax=Pieris brassicae TaxID=7116 RepID=UPI001E65E38F|nr:partner of xrn-2 protein 1-like [Pieris brassicae]